MWPGWTFCTYRAFDLAVEDSYLADIIPWSAAFTAHLEGAEAIYNGARGNLVGTGAGKSVILTDLLAQIGHRFGFQVDRRRRPVTRSLTQIQGCEPIIVNPNGRI